MEFEDKTPFDDAFPGAHAAMEKVHEMLDKLEMGATASIIIR